MKKGFTLIELIIVIAGAMVLMTVSVSGYFLLRQSTELSNSSEEIINALRLQQSKSMATNQDSQFGIWFDSASGQYTLFKGATYSTRDSADDVIKSVSRSVEISSVSFSGGSGSASETVFDKITGTTSQTGSVTIWLKGDNLKTRTIYVDASGTVSYNPRPENFTDTYRTYDSRRVHFNYNRNADITNETIDLYFDGSSTTAKTILISENIIGGKFSWQGSVSVGGYDQTLKIETLIFNPSSLPDYNPNLPYYQFSVTRDRRYNNKSLVITISGDFPDQRFLISYPADGAIDHLNDPVGLRGLSPNVITDSVVVQ